MRGSQSVENMRAALMDLLGKGGRKFREFDDAYAAAVRDRLRSDQTGGFHTARNLAAEVLGAPVTYGVGKSDRDPRTQTLGYVMDTGAAYTVPVASVAARYGIPIAGVSAAGMGLMEIMDALDAEEAMKYHDEHIMIPFNPQA